VPRWPGVTDSDIRQCNDGFAPACAQRSSRAAWFAEPECQGLLPMVPMRLALLPALLLLLLLLPPPAATVGGGGGSQRPTIESLRTTCPEEVAACEAEAACKREFRGSFAPDAPPPSEQPSDLLMAIIRCFNANVEGHPKLPADSCPAEMEVCEGTEGCVDELHAALNAVAPPTEGSEELMAVVECLKRVSVEAARAKGADKSELLQAATADCPAELQACEGAAGCMDEFERAAAQREPPKDGSAPMLAIIDCLRQAALARRKQQLEAAGPGGSGDAPGKMKFKPAEKMSEEERAAAHEEMVERVAVEVACGLCETLLEDIWTRSLQTPWIQALKSAAAESTTDSAAEDGGDVALHISGASVAKACAVQPLPAFASAYSVHPCTAAAAKEGRCAARQQYHLRNSTDSHGDGCAATSALIFPSVALFLSQLLSSGLFQPLTAHRRGRDSSPPSEDEFGSEILASMYSKSAKQQERLDAAVFRSLCDDVLVSTFTHSHAASTISAVHPSWPSIDLCFVCWCESVQCVGACKAR
jgi:hypothetical protein